MVIADLVTFEKLLDIHQFSVSRSVLIFFSNNFVSYYLMLRPQLLQKGNDGIVFTLLHPS